MKRVLTYLMGLMAVLCLSFSASATVSSRRPIVLSEVRNNYRYNASGFYRDVATDGEHGSIRGHTALAISVGFAKCEASTNSVAINTSSCNYITMEIRELETGKLVKTLSNKASGLTARVSYSWFETMPALCIYTAHETRNASGGYVEYAYNWCS